MENYWAIAIWDMQGLVPGHYTTTTDTRIKEHPAKLVRTKGNDWYGKVTD